MSDIQENAFPATMEVYSKYSVGGLEPVAVARWLTNIKLLTQDPLETLFTFEIVKNWAFCCAAKSDKQYIENLMHATIAVMMESGLMDEERTKQTVKIANSVVEKELAVAKTVVEKELATLTPKEN